MLNVFTTCIYKKYLSFYLKNLLPVMMLMLLSSLFHCATPLNVRGLRLDKFKCFSVLVVVSVIVVKFSCEFLKLSRNTEPFAQLHSLCLRVELGEVKHAS